MNFVWICTGLGTPTVKYTLPAKFAFMRSSYKKIITPTKTVSKSDTVKIDDTKKTIKPLCRTHNYRKKQRRQSREHKRVQFGTKTKNENSALVKTVEHSD